LARLLGQRWAHSELCRGQFVRLRRSPVEVVRAYKRREQQQARQDGSSSISTVHLFHACQLDGECQRRPLGAHSENGAEPGLGETEVHVSLLVPGQPTAAEPADTKRSPRSEERGPRRRLIRPLAVAEWRVAAWALWLGDQFVFALGCEVSRGVCGILGKSDAGREERRYEEGSNDSSHAPMVATVLGGQLPPKGGRLPGKWRPAACASALLVYSAWPRRCRSARFEN